MFKRSILYSFSLLIAVLFLDASGNCQRAHASQAAKNRKVSKQKKERDFTQKDRELLENLLKTVLFDPKEARRVEVDWTRRDSWGSSSKTRRRGWFVEGKNKTPNLIFFLDGESIPASEAKNLKKINFLEDYKTTFKKAKDGFYGKDSSKHYWSFGVFSSGSSESSIRLVYAAWLYRLGHEEEATKAFHKSREFLGSDQKMLKKLREDLAWRTFSIMASCFNLKEDRLALIYGKRLFAKYKQEAKKFPQATAILKDLERRKKEKKFGTSMKFPKDFKKLPLDKKIGLIIESMEDLGSGESGGDHMDWMPYDDRLVKLGDKVIPALIDVIENDDRLTRRVNFSHRFRRYVSLPTVRDVALRMSNTILQVDFPSSDDLRRRIPDEKKRAIALAKNVRDYWNKYGKMPLDERMMKQLTDPKTTCERTRKAASNLAYFQTMGVASWFLSSEEPPTDDPKKKKKKRINPVIAKFKNPTVAEAILKAMDRDLVLHEKYYPYKESADMERREIEDYYFKPLLGLKDNRITTELKRRYKSAKHYRMKRKYAVTLYRFRDSSAIKDFANKLEKGQHRIPQEKIHSTYAYERDHFVELRGIIEDFASIGLPETDRALYAFIDPKHPHHEQVTQRLIRVRFSDNDGWNENKRAWFYHPYCLNILRQQLEDTTATRFKFKIEKNEIAETWWDYDNKQATTHRYRIPASLSDPTKRRENATVRICDIAAKRLSRMVMGIPGYHSLEKEFEQSIENMKKEFDRFRGRYRRLSWQEGELLGIYDDEYAFWREEAFNNNNLFYPDIKPLGKPAAEKDVKEGKAIFHLNGKGKTSKLKLPAIGIIKNGIPRGPRIMAYNPNKKKEKPKRTGRKILILQAELDSDGKPIYGIVGDGKVRMVKGEEVRDVRTIEKKQE